MSTIISNLYTIVAIIISVIIFLKLLYSSLKSNSSIINSFNIYKITFVAIFGFILILISGLLESANNTAIVSAIYIFIYLLVLSTYFSINEISDSISGAIKKIKKEDYGPNSGTLNSLLQAISNPKLIIGILLLLLSIGIFWLVNSGLL